MEAAACSCRGGRESGGPEGCPGPHRTSPVLLRHPPRSIPLSLRPSSSRDLSPSPVLLSRESKSDAGLLPHARRSSIPKRRARLIWDASSDATGEVRAGLKIGEEGRGYGILKGDVA
jgi:hypothetical protein